MSSKEKTFSEKDFSRAKIIGVGVLIFVLWLGLWGRAYQLQIVRGEDLASRAKGQYWCQEKVLGRRGEIYDRQGMLLARSVTVNSVYANPMGIEDIQGSSHKLARILEKDRDSILSRLTKKKNFVWLKRKVTDKVANRISEMGLSGVHLLREYKRVYPQGRLAGQVLGFAGIDGQGLEGLEKSQNKHLQGRKRRIVMQRDGSGALIADARETGESVNGQDLVLTIDGQLQFVAEKELSRAVRKYSAKSGACIVANVENGDILAWAHYPFFNPNRFSTSAPFKWRNWSATDLSEPGSTLKPFLVAAALEEGACQADSLYFCENGKWKIAGNEIKDTHEYEWLPVNKVVRYSSNIGAAKIGMDLGSQRFYDYLKLLGLDEPLDLPLPGQGGSILRPPHKWTTVDLVSASFGQGLAVTPLQIMRAYLCLANDGVRKELRIIKNPAQPKQKKIRVFSSAVSARVRSMLAEVVQEDGTATRARIKGLEVGGKTGTAQKASPEGGYSRNYVASFIGLFPAMQPKYVIMCLIDEPEKNIYGGVVAAPVVREVGMRIKGMGELLPADRPEAKQLMAKNPGSELRRAITSSAAVVTEQGKMPDLRGMNLRGAVEALAEFGTIPELKGNGVVIAKQNPSPGADFNPENQVVLWLEGSGNG
ncbi:MAG: penicillin-binding transpeptidase domain-containing protein [Thermodesulfobacteriota bacterium]